MAMVIAFFVSGCKRKQTPPPEPPAPEILPTQPTPPAPPTTRPKAQLPKKRTRAEDMDPLPPFLNFERDQSVTEFAEWLAQRTGQKLMKELASALRSGGTIEAIPFCKQSAPQIAAEFSKNYRTTIQRVSHRPRNPANRVKPFERAIIRNYLQREFQDAPFLPRIEKPDANTKIVYAPIFLTLPTCLQCHGQPRKEIKADTLAALRQLYPRDEAKGFKLGDIRGLWKVTVKRETQDAINKDTQEKMKIQEEK
jgi:hypothetical protein